MYKSTVNVHLATTTCIQTLAKAEFIKKELIMYHDLNCLAEYKQQQAKIREFIKSRAVFDEEEVTPLNELAIKRGSQLLRFYQAVPVPRFAQCRLQPMRGSRRFELMLRMQGL